MENIDVRDSPEEQAQLVAAFVEFLKQREQRRSSLEQTVLKTPAENPFTSWPLGVKGTLSREKIYEYLG